MKKVIIIFLVIFIFIFSVDVMAGINEFYLSSDKIDTKIKYYEIDSKKPGPTAVITAGIHGDEPAGHFAALKLKDYKLMKGKMYIFPAINNYGLNNNTRYYLDEIDLNRSFPGEIENNRGEVLAHLLFDFISKKADIVIDLHESEHCGRENNNYYGQSIIAGTNDESIRYGMNVVSKINEEISESKYKYILNSYPVKNSLVWAVVKELRIPAFMVETCKEMQIKERIDYQLKITKYLLIEAGVKIDE